MVSVLTFGAPSTCRAHVAELKQLRPGQGLQPQRHPPFHVPCARGRIEAKLGDEACALLTGAFHVPCARGRIEAYPGPSSRQSACLAPSTCRAHVAELKQTARWTYSFALRNLPRAVRTWPN